MTAYIIFLREDPIHDADEMAQYGAKVRGASAGFDLAPIALYGQSEGLEGPTPDGVVIMRFPDMAEARRWYHSPGYQDAAAHRMKGANYRAILTEGL